jgi:hypothetical protein
MVGNGTALSSLRWMGENVISRLATESHSKNALRASLRKKGIERTGFGAREARRRLVYDIVLYVSDFMRGE